MKKIIALTLLLLCYHTSAFSYWQGFAYYDYSMGEIKGFTQTPRGGIPGSSSFDRPSFEEINIHHDHFYEMGAGVQYNHFFALLDYWNINPHGSNTLTQTLYTHAHTIPANSDFKMQINYQWYRFGMGKDIVLDQNKTTISPLLYGSWLNFLYEFYAYPADSSRFYTLLSLQAGVNISHQFSQNLSGFIEAAGTVPLSNLNILYGKIGLHYSLINAKGFSIIPTFYVIMLKIDYEDDQAMPNHIHYTANPHATLGLLVLTH